jgi:signal transduction histidine kinase
MNVHSLAVVTPLSQPLIVTRRGIRRAATFCVPSIRNEGIVDRMETPPATRSSETDRTALRRPDRSVANPFVALLIGVIVLPVVLLALLALQDRDARVATALTDAEQQALALAEHAGKVFESNLLALDLINGQIADLDWTAIRADGVRLHQQMSQVGRRLEQTNVLLLIDPAGSTVIETSRPLGAPSIDVSHREYFRAHIGGGSTVYVGQPLLGLTTNVRVFHVSRPRTMADGRFDGVLVASMFPGYFEAIWQTLNPDPADNIALLRDDGTLLAHRSADPSYETKARDRQAAIRDRLIGSAGASRAESAIDGLDRAIAYRQVGALPVYVQYGLGLRPVLEDWRRTWTVVAIVAGLGVLILAATTVVAMRRSREEADARMAVARTAARLGVEIERRQATEAGILRAQKMEALGQLTGGVAHDINNLLTAIGGNLRLMDRDVAAGSRGRFASAIEAVESAAAVTRRLLAFSRREAVNVEPVDVGAALLRLRPLLDRAVRADICLEIETTRDRTVCELDPGQFEACLLNLATNARDAMPGPGHLRLRTQRTILTDRPDGLNGPFVVVDVSDTGHGMTDEIAARAFDPFFTTKEVGQGTGLGLSTVYAFARQSGGTVEIETVQGEGTTVRILLPETLRDVAAKQSDPRDLAIDMGSRVLVVEDSVLVRMVTEDALREAGYEVVGAGDSVQASRILDEQPPFDMMVTDVVMPRGVSGLELARDAARRRPEMKVLLVSGYSREYLANLGEGDEFELMAKPFTPDDLTRRVRSMLSGRLAGAVSADRP